MYKNASQSIGETLGKMGLYRLGAGGLIDAELTAYFSGFAVLEDKLLHTIKNAFVSTGEAEGLAQFEALLGFYSGEDSTIVERRQRISARMNISADSDNISSFLKTLKGIGIEGAVMEGAYKKQVTITINRFSNGAITFVQAAHLIEKILPAHLECILIYGDNPFNDLDEKSLLWSDWDAKGLNWNSFDFAEKNSI